MNELMQMAVDLMHPAFHGYTASGVQAEFYHQFRKLWDKAVPVGLGLGHILLRSTPGGCEVHRLAEGDRPAAALARIDFAETPAPAAGFERTFSLVANLTTRTVTLKELR
jgi:hypothetical protein